VQKSGKVTDLAHRRRSLVSLARTAAQNTVNPAERQEKMGKMTVGFAKKNGRSRSLIAE